MHYIKYGWKENRNPNSWFDTKFYMEKYNDLLQEKENPLVHYITFGRENRLYFNNDVFYIDDAMIINSLKKILIDIRYKEIHEFIIRMLRSSIKRFFISNPELEKYCIVLLYRNIDNAIKFFSETYGYIPDLYIMDFDENNISSKYETANINIRRFSGISRKRIYIYAQNDTSAETYFNSLAWSIRFFYSHYNISKLYIDIGILYPNRPGYILENNPINIEYIIQNYKKIMRIYHHMADEASKNTMADVVMTYLTRNTGYLDIEKYGQYWHPEIQAEEGDIIFDGGIFDGISTRNMAQRVGPHGHIYAFEPIIHDKKSLIGEYENTITLEKLGLWSSETTVKMHDLGSASTVLYKNNDLEAFEVEMTTVDIYERKNKTSCSMIKLDVEGAEPYVIDGAQNTIKKCLPKLLISVYHNPHSQFFDIPQKILDIDDRYIFFLGHHEFMYNETILYAKIVDISAH